MGSIVMLVFLALTGDIILAKKCFYGNDSIHWLTVTTYTNGNQLVANCSIDTNFTTNATFTWQAVRPICNEADRKTLESVPTLVNITSSSSISLVSINHHGLFGFENATFYCLVDGANNEVNRSEECFFNAEDGMNQTNGVHNKTLCDIDSSVSVKPGQSRNLTITNGGEVYSVHVSDTSRHELVSVSVNVFGELNKTLNDNQKPGSDVIDIEILPLSLDQPSRRPVMMITFPIKRFNATITKPNCAYYKDLRKWSTKHCRTMIRNETVLCNCSRGSKIAVLMIDLHTCGKEPCGKVKSKIDDGTGSGGYYLISLPPPVGVTVSSEAEVTPKQNYPSPKYFNNEIKVRFSSDVLEVRMLDEKGTELTNFQQDPVELGFPVQPYNASAEKPLCCYFVETKSIWSDDGCSVKNKNGTYVTCSCNHLTSFAILMRPIEIQLSPENERILDILTKIGLCLSITCLTATLLIYAVFRMKSLRIVIHADLAFALLAAHIVFLFIGTKNEVACRFIAISLHFFLLAAFVWMFLEGVFLLIKATPTFRWNIKIPVWLSVGWGCPAAIVLISMGFRFEGYKTKTCWLSTEYNFRWAFLAPVLVIIMANTALLVRLIVIFMSLQTNKKKDEAQKMKAGLRLVLLLEPMLGIPWLFGLFYDSIALTYVFVIFNTLQGVFFFVVQCLLDHEVRRKFMALNPDRTTKVLSLTTSTSGQDNKRVKGSAMTSQSGAPPRLFVMSNKMQSMEESRNPKPTSELEQREDQDQHAREKQERSLTSLSNLEEVEDIDGDLKTQSERSTSLVSLSSSSGTDGGEGTNNETEVEADKVTHVHPISLTALSDVDNTPGTDDEPGQEPEYSTSSISLSGASLSRASKLRGTEEEPDQEPENSTSSLSRASLSRASKLEGTDEEPGVLGSRVSLEAEAILIENEGDDGEIKKTKPGSLPHSEETTCSATNEPAQDGRNCKPNKENINEAVRESGNRCKRVQPNYRPSIVKVWRP